jgi:hypothetical protein
MKNTDVRFAKNKYLEVSELGTRLNLSFSSQLAFGDKIIALDGLKRRLLVLYTGKEPYEPFVIDLNKVAAVTVKKSYGSIKHGELKNKGIEEFLKRIDLQFEFSDHNETIVLTFYDSDLNDKHHCAMLGRNAKTWEMILSKMTGSQPDKNIKEQNELTLAPLSLVNDSYA